MRKKSAKYAKACAVEMKTSSYVSHCRKIILFWNGRRESPADTKKSQTHLFRIMPRTRIFARIRRSLSRHISLRLHSRSYGLLGFNVYGSCLAKLSFEVASRHFNLLRYQVKIIFYGHIFSWLYPEELCLALMHFCHIYFCYGTLWD